MVFVRLGLVQQRRCYTNGITQPNTILNILGPIAGLSEEDAQNLIDNNFTVPQPRYTSEELFRLDEFNCLTKAQNYQNGTYRDEEDTICESEGGSCFCLCSSSRNIV